ncbi:MAG: 50S ribosomal protein L29 [Thermoguttaceae bacterium]
MKSAELRNMSLDQLQQILRETRESLFKLKLQSRMEKLDAPSELHKSKKLIARVLTIINERNRASATVG